MSHNRDSVQKRIERSVTVSNVLTSLWTILIWWEESYAFKRAISKHKWSQWENWSSKSTRPYRIALIADPQLVDENTYERRGLLLRISQFYTDLYMKRNWRYIHAILEPKMTIFLGDLFDGGREWDDETWTKEYKRFRKIFPQKPATPYIASLPGNHDIGISDTVSPAALSRFKEHFGEPSTEFRAGDFTIILLDTASLSANIASIQDPPMQFLNSLKSSSPTEPRILLTHIPLFRPPGTSCGPLRESNQPIRPEKGYQFQNLLTSDLSKNIVDTVRPLVAFSGDDHDYCYVQHNYGGMKFPEYTVKSFSWAMGVNNPGFQLLSLSNSRGAAATPEFFTTPVVLPNQLYVFITYGIALVITLIIIIASNWFKLSSLGSVLPTYMKRRSDEIKGQRWRSSKKQQLRKTLTSSLTDFRKIGVWGLLWYLYLIWY